MWEIKINWDCCPYLEEVEFDKIDTINKCNNKNNKKPMNYGLIVICDKRNCPIKVEK